MEQNVRLRVNTCCCIAQSFFVRNFANDLRNANAWTKFTQYYEGRHMTISKSTCTRSENCNNI